MSIALAVKVALKQASALKRRARGWRAAVLYHARRPEGVAGGVVGCAVVALLAVVIAFPHQSDRQGSVEVATTDVLPPPPAPREKKTPTVSVEPTEEQIRTARAVPDQVADVLIDALDEIDDLESRKRLFMRVMVPIIVEENEMLADHRQRLLESKGAIPYDLVSRYGVDDRDALLKRVDVIPPSLVLAQAAVESGWGTSRFAKEGNSFFGQRSYGIDPDGLVPERARGFTVKRFDTIADSVRAYLHNLNTHRAYADFRAARAAMRRKSDTLAGSALAIHLSRYSEEGYAYVEKLRKVIQDNRLTDLDSSLVGG